jgi:hypothetical protein
MVIALSFCLQAAVMFENVAAQECRVIRVWGESMSKAGGKISVQPETVWISKGTCIIWNNWVPGKEVSVSFDDGKNCNSVVDASMDFVLKENGCFITAVNMVPGGTASLRFNKEGTFAYRVETADGIQTKGQIVVQ